MKGLVLSSDVFERRGDKWVTDRDRVKQYPHDEEGIDRSNPDIDQYTRATFKGSDSRLQVTRGKSVIVSRDPASIKRFNLLRRLNTLAHKEGF